MSRIAKSPIQIPASVEFKLEANQVSAKGSLGNLSLVLDDRVEVTLEDKVIKVAPKNPSLKAAWAIAGTTRSLINNLVVGVSEGFSKTLEINGVGYRAQVSGNTINLSLGFSHPVEYQLPEGITAEAPSNTVLVLKGADKQKLGQCAAEIRSYRLPEPYKGKGIRYSDERVLRKEAKKK